MRFFKMALLYLLWAQCAFSTPSDLYPFTRQADAERFYALTQTIRCVVCQNQNINDSNAPLANDLRAKVYAMVLEKQSDAAIQKYLVQRYGDFILLQPRFNPITAALWLIPFLSLLLGIGWVLYQRLKPTMINY